MISFKQKLLELIKDEEGLTTVEYAIAGSLVGAAVVTAFSDLGDAVGEVITGLTDAITSDGAGAGDGGAADGGAG